jgi:hypothetical protein
MNEEELRPIAQAVSNNNGERLLPLFLCNKKTPPNGGAMVSARRLDGQGYNPIWQGDRFGKGQDEAGHVWVCAP